MIGCYKSNDIRQILNQAYHTSHNKNKTYVIYLRVSWTHTLPSDMTEKSSVWLRTVWDASTRHSVMGKNINIFI